MERIINLITDCYERMKPFFVLIATWVATVLMPIKESLFVLGMTFVFNFVIGMSHSVNIEKQQFSLKKAFEALIQLCVFGSLIFLVNSTFTAFGDLDVAVEAVKWITYIVVYFYATNIFRNLSLIWPKMKAFEFIYDLLTTKIFDKLKEMVGFTKKNEL